MGARLPNLAQRCKWPLREFHVCQPILGTSCPWDAGEDSFIALRPPCQSCRRRSVTYLHLLLKFSEQHPTHSSQATIIIAVRLIFDLRPVADPLEPNAGVEYIVSSASVDIAIDPVSVGSPTNYPADGLPSACGVVMVLTHLAYLAALLVRRPYVDLRCFAVAVAFSFAQVRAHVAGVILRGNSVQAP